MNDIWAIREARLAEEEAPLVADLRAAGVAVTSVWNLVNSRASYPHLVPVLMKHLHLPYSDRTRSGIARALAVPASHQYWDFLVQLYCDTQEGHGPVFPGEDTEFKLGMKDALACSLAGSVTEHTLPELISLAKDAAHGESRLLLLTPLKRSKSPIAKDALEELRHDPQFSKEINSWRKR